MTDKKLWPGGETIKQINQQSGAYCELDRRAQTSQNEKTFIIRGEVEQVEAAKRIISEKVQIPLNFINVGMSNNLPTVRTTHTHTPLQFLAPPL